jgi:hypothetical protein
MSGLGPSIMKIWARRSSPQSGSRNAWARIKNVNGGSCLCNFWDFFIWQDPESHHPAVAIKKWLRISTFWHSITIFLFDLHFSCDYAWDVQLCLKTRTCPCTEHFRSIKVMLCPISLMSLTHTHTLSLSHTHTQVASSPVVMVTVVHNILKWEIL